MEKELKQLETIKSDIRFFQRGLHWGTKLDEIDIKQIPSKYLTIEFREMNHDRLNEFFLSSNREKFEMAYWAERINSKRSAKYGFYAGFGLAIIIYLIFQQL